MRRVDGTGCLVTPGLINTHHHLYQWATRGLALDETLFGWLTTLYPIWGRLDAEIVGAAAGAGLGWLALSGCTTSMDHHYVFPRDGGDVLAAEIEAARQIGLRFHPDPRLDGPEPEGRAACRRTTWSRRPTRPWRRPRRPSTGGTTRRPRRCCRSAVAPCSPFSVTSKLMSEAAVLARRKGVRLHTHLAETDDEEDFCQEQVRLHAGRVRRAAGVAGRRRVAGARRAPGRRGRRQARRDRHRGGALPELQRPAGRGRWPGSATCSTPGARSAWASTARPPRRPSHLGEELRQALYVARLRGGPTALTARESLRLGTMGGARCLGRQDDLGSIEVGKLADLVLWRLDGLGHDGIDDKVAALVFGPAAPVELALVGGKPVVERGELVNADAETLTRRARRAHRRLLTGL